MGINHWQHTFTNLIMVFWLYEIHGGVDRTPQTSHVSQTPPLLNIYTLNRSYIMLEMKTLAEAYQGDFIC